MVLLATVAQAATPEMLRLPADAAVARAAQSRWAEHLTVPVEVTNCLEMRLALIPPGRFVMGPNGTTQRVTLSRPYYLAVTEVTLGQYRRFRPGHQIAGAAPEFNADDRPAAMVSWEDALAFCRWLSDQSAEKQAGRVYTLPTSAQWEWAARAGTTTSRHFGEDAKGQEQYSWFNHTYTTNPQHEVDGRGRQPVAKLPPNAWGLFDLLGNVWEWCADRPADPSTGESWDPIMRGGSWRSGAFHCTSVAHDPGDSHQTGDHIGFRVLCTVPAISEAR